MTSDRPALPPLVARLLRDVPLLLDASDEAENNTRRGEAAFLSANLRSCTALARQIDRRVKGKRLRRLLAKMERGGR